MLVCVCVYECAHFSVYDIRWQTWEEWGEIVLQEDLGNQSISCTAAAFDLDNQWYSYNPLRLLMHTSNAVNGIGNRSHA